LLNSRTALLRLLFYLLGEALPLPVPLSAREVYTSLDSGIAAFGGFIKIFYSIYILRRIGNGTERQSF